MSEHMIADQSVAGLCKAEGANRVTTSNTKRITLHLLLTGIDGMHYPMKMGVVVVVGGLLQCNHHAGALWCYLSTNDTCI